MSARYIISYRTRWRIPFVVIPAAVWIAAYLLRGLVDNLLGIWKVVGMVLLHSAESYIHTRSDGLQ
jgi:hypothetical protein